MLLAVSFVIGAGLVFTVMGCLLSVTAERGHAMPALMLVAGAGLGLGGLLQVDPAAVRATPWAMMARLAVVMLTAGAVTTLGMAVLHTAMKRGAPATAWTLGQSAMAVPFLAGVLVFGDTAEALQWVGLAAMVVSLVLFGRARSGGASGAAVTPRGGRLGDPGFRLGLAAMLVLGLSQTLTALPSQVSGLSDPGGLRVTLVGLGRAASAACLVQVWRLPMTRGVLVFGGWMTLVSLCGQTLLFRGLDRLGGYGQAAIGFPLAVGVCILGFTVYAVATGREKTGVIRLAACIICVLGVLLMAIPLS